MVAVFIFIVIVIIAAVITFDDNDSHGPKPL